MIETERLKLYPASKEQMEVFIESQTVDVLKAAYTEMLNGCIEHSEQWDWYAIWMIELKDGTHIGELCIKGLSSEEIINIGCCIDYDYEGQRCVTEAAEAVATWAFQQNTTTFIAKSHDRDIAFKDIFDKCGYVQSGTRQEIAFRFAFKPNGEKLKIAVNALTLYDIYKVLEDVYGFDFEYDSEGLYIRNQNDDTLKFYFDRLNNFEVCEGKRLLYESLDEISETMFITLTDKYGEDWKLHDLLKSHPEDDLPKALDSYLDYLDRVGDLYSYLQRMGYDLNDM